MSILALDIGKKKIGAAISRSGLLAEEYCTINFKNELLAITQIIFLIKKEKITRLAVGLPLDGQGLDTEQTRYVRDFVEKLKERLANYKINLKVILINEFLTSKEAERQLLKQGLNFQAMLNRRDKFSAKLILDQYLDNKTTQ